MPVFVTGAAGFIGSELVRQLVAAGHEVRGLARNPQGARIIEASGATALVGDVRDPKVLRAGVRGMDAVAHLALPRAGEKNLAEASDVSDRGTRAILEACRGTSLHSFVFASGALGIYPHAPGEWVDESDHEDPKTPSIRGRWALDNLVRAAHTEWGLPATILRPPIVYGTGSGFQEFFLDLMWRRVFRIPGDGSYYIDLVSVEDAAAAYRLALEQAPVGETFLVTDDEPVTMRTFADFLAKEMGRRPPGRVPPFLAKLIAGREAVEVLMESIRLTNRKIKDRLGWTPTYPTYRQGIPDVVARYLKSVV